MWHDARLLNVCANVLFVTAALIVLGGVLHWGTQQPLFTIKAIRLHGAEKPLRYIKANHVRAEMLPRLRGNFFSANLEETRRVFETLPWVRKASVRRQWPDKLEVTLEEHRALGTWGDGRLLNVHGEIFVANLAEAEEDGPLAHFSGPAGTEKEVTRRYQELKQRLATIGEVPTHLALTPRYAWQAKLASGTQIEFGREQDASTFGSRLDRLVQAWPHVQAKLTRTAEYVDLRYANGFALRATGLKLMDESKLSSQKT